MDVSKTLLGVVIVMIAIIISTPVASGLRSAGVPINP